MVSRALEQATTCNGDTMAGMRQIPLYHPLQDKQVVAFIDSDFLSVVMVSNVPCS